MSTDVARRRSPSEILKRGYSDDEVSHIYELGRLFIENGDLRRAEAIMVGLTEVAPDFVPGWLGLAYLSIQAKNFEAALTAARYAVKLSPESAEAMLFLVTALLSTKDYNTAGTYLGEVGEKVEAGTIENPHVVRFYRSQLARYQSR